MKKVILINVILSVLIFGCSSSTVEYLPTVVYLKAPELINIDGKNQTYVELAVSDLNEEEGSIEIKFKSKGKNILEKTIDKLLFSTDGTVISFYYEELASSEKFDVELKVCNVDELCREQLFEGVELNTEPETDKINITGQMISSDKNFNVSVFLSSSNIAITPDKETGVFELNDIDKGKYNLYTKGEDTDNGFYRYIYLKTIDFSKSTKIYLYAPLEENQEYDEPLVDCSFSTKSNTSYMFLIFLMMLFVFKFRINEGKKF